MLGVVVGAKTPVGSVYAFWSSWCVCWQGQRWLCLRGTLEHTA